MQRTTGKISQTGPSGAELLPQNIPTHHVPSVVPAPGEGERGGKPAALSTQSFLHVAQEKATMGLWKGARASGILLENVEC